MWQGKFLFTSIPPGLRKCFMNILRYSFLHFLRFVSMSIVKLGANVYGKIDFTSESKGSSNSTYIVLINLCQKWRSCLSSLSRKYLPHILCDTPCNRALVVSRGRDRSRPYNYVQEKGIFVHWMHKENVNPFFVYLILQNFNGGVVIFLLLIYVGVWSWHYFQQQVFLFP